MSVFHPQWSVEPGLASRDRRYGQRARILWRGEYRAVNPVASQEWQRCYLVDISDRGAALEVHGDDVEVGQILIVRLEPHPTYSRSWRQLRATVVNRRSSHRPHVFGVEFTGLLKEQHDLFLGITMVARRDLRRRRRYKPDA
jgi:hypothetical protein